MSKIRELLPSDFTLEKLDEELASMACIRALPQDYGSFISSLLLKDTLDKAAVYQAFVTEEIQCCRHAADSAQMAMATSAFLQKAECEFCGKPGHAMSKCYAPQNAQKDAKAKKNKPKQKKHTEQANQAKESDKDKNDNGSDITEFAGNASTRLPDHSDLSSPLQLDADFNWIADTGATSHMTTHRHWVRNYTQFCIPIKLADSSVIYSAGVGTVVFNPVVKGKSLQSVEFTRVLHVPQLRNNLLSCLYLTRNKGFHIHIDAEFLHFQLNKKELFCDSINSNNSAHLNGVTEAILEYAHLTSIFCCYGSSNSHSFRGMPQVPGEVHHTGQIPQVCLHILVPSLHLEGGRHLSPDQRLSG